MSHPDNGVDAVLTNGDEIYAVQAKRTARPLETQHAETEPVHLWWAPVRRNDAPTRLKADSVTALPAPPSSIDIRATDRERLLILCAIRHPELGRIDWPLLARTAQTPQALDHWYAGEVTEQSPKADKARRILRWALNDSDAQDQAEEFLGRQLAAAADVGAHLTTVLDADYPANLRMVPDAPPFLFYRGHLDISDARSIAVVGTREATADGRARAARMARGLSDAGVVVVSGLARGIDAAAHTSTVDRGRRTVAVIGAGIATKIYPPENTPLAERIIDSGGAIVSQFWPTDPPEQWRFPARNITMSGFTQGTVVVEASSSSGAKMQAQAARRHFRTVFLLHSLTMAQHWARTMLNDARAELVQPQQLDLLEPSPPDRDLPLAVVEVGDVDDVLSRVADADAVRAAANLRHELAYAWPAA
ncbi:DNA-processing protein DprA [Actinoplanes subglobosus]|uniref:DNA-processing protein DprA n=1 Tax=Actinoplanes subglobosus TaxID=1547892 RepID=A0ABV8ILG0_9ACTN